MSKRTVATKNGRFTGPWLSTCRLLRVGLPHVGLIRLVSLSYYS